jgi:hypothetical protein
MVDNLRFSTRKRADVLISVEAMEKTLTEQLESERREHAKREEAMKQYYLEQLKKVKSVEQVEEEVVLFVSTKNGRVTNVKVVGRENDPEPTYDHLHKHRQMEAEKAALITRLLAAQESQNDALEKANSKHVR